MVNGGELAMYNHNHILGQLFVATNQPKDIDQYTPAKNKVRLAVCFYDTSTGEFHGIAIKLAYIIFCGDDEECFLAMGIRKRSQ